MIHTKRLDNKVPICLMPNDPKVFIFQDIPEPYVKGEFLSVCPECKETLTRWNREAEIEVLVDKILAGKKTPHWHFWLMFVYAILIGFLSGYITYISFRS